MSLCKAIINLAFALGMLVNAQMALANDGVIEFENVQSSFYQRRQKELENGHKKNEYDVLKKELSSPISAPSKRVALNNYLKSPNFLS
jgi:hypothetical protein